MESVDADIATLNTEDGVYEFSLSKDSIKRMRFAVLAAGLTFIVAVAASKPLRFDTEVDLLVSLVVFLPGFLVQTTLVLIIAFYALPRMMRGFVLCIAGDSLEIRPPKGNPRRIDLKNVSEIVSYVDANSDPQRLILKSDTGDLRVLGYEGMADIERLVTSLIPPGAQRKPGTSKLGRWPLMPWGGWAFLAAAWTLLLAARAGISAWGPFVMLRVSGAVMVVSGIVLVVSMWRNPNLYSRKDVYLYLVFWVVMVGCILSIAWVLRYSQVSM